jgi:hypothetical protein
MMKGSYYLLLIFPVSILFAGFIVLRADLYPKVKGVSPQLTMDSTITQTKRTDTIPVKDTNGQRATYFSTGVTIKKTGDFRPDEVRHEEKAMPYFILASVFIVVIMALPRLRELSISQQSIVLKLFDQVKEAAADLDEATSPVGAEALRTGISRQKVLILQDRIKMMDRLLTKSSK